MTQNEKKKTLKYPAKRESSVALNKDPVKPM